LTDGGGLAQCTPLVSISFLKVSRAMPFRPTDAPLARPADAIMDTAARLIAV